MDAMRAERMALRFVLPDGAWSAKSYGNGHINETYLLTAEDNGVRFILQKLNGYVFRRPEDVMTNIEDVTRFLAERVRQEGGDAEREVLHLLPTRAGEVFARDEAGSVWRVFCYAEGTVARDTLDSPLTFEETGRGFGRFLRRLSGYPVQTLKETIPDFHNTPERYRQLEEAVRRDEAGRLRDVQPELSFCRERAAACGALLAMHRDGQIPLRVTHNDTKINNLLLDAESGQALVVIDLDTVMPGFAAYDFGDAIRTGASTAAEDERDLTRVTLSLPMFEAFARGFLQEAGGVMEAAEIDSLAEGARLMSLENGLRFLADHLNGDRYFRVHRPGQNLDRARAQFALVRDMERKMEDMRRILKSLAPQGTDDASAREGL